MDAYLLDVKEVFKALESSEKGLTDEGARRRIETYGPNELKKEKGISPAFIFFSQFKSFLILILIIAVIISAALGEMIDAIVILIIVIINAILGFFQEYRAEKTMDALKKLSSPHALVLRGGKKQEIDSKELVPGDILMLEEGTRVPADCRLIKVVNLKTDEAPLTGESTPVTKDVGRIGKAVPVADMQNMVFAGTSVSYGRGEAVVVSTGMNTNMGKIAEMIESAEEKETPLQVKLAGLGKRIGIVILFICALVFVSGVARGNPMPLMFITAVSLAVAAIPEGLPAVVTVTLALGLKRMAGRNAIIRRLPAVETLGCSTVICSDKTGTLTKNEMTVHKLYANKRVYGLSGEGYTPSGIFSSEGKKAVPGKELSLLLKIGVLCNNAELYKERDRWHIRGDPTEGALLVSAKKANVAPAEKRVHEMPFDSTRKRMSVACKQGGKEIAYVKGAPEIILGLCKKIYQNGKVSRLTPAQKKQILKINERMAGDALRVLAMAYKPLKNRRGIESDLIFVGLQGMIDSPREEARHAVELCKKAGVRVVMITGDHRSTAVAIAKQLDMLGEGDKALTGAELDRLDDRAFAKTVNNISVYARVSPEHKTRIVKALKSKGHVVAMTGDGVNDAPALKNADIGVAMGITGTDVTKEASDMVLTDDNFASVVSAVEEGRGVYENIKKFVRYLLSCNVGEVLTVFCGIMLYPVLLPLSALQILWMNLVTDGLPALALGVDPPDKDVMQRPPRNPKEEMLTLHSIMGFVSVGIIMAIGTLLIFFTELADPVRAQTMAFTTLVMFQMFIAFTSRSQKHLSFRKITFANKYLVLAVMSSLALQMAVIYFPPLQGFFGTVSLGMLDWVKIVAVSVTASIAIEGWKILRKTR